MMRQVQKMQEDMQNFQAEFENREFTATAGGGMIEVTMTGSHEMKKITIEDAILADQLFSTLMGDEVEPRRAYIIEHAHEVMNLDV